MPANDALHGGKADSGAVELGGRVQPLEYAEQFRRVGHVEPSAVIAHEICRRVAVDGADLNAGRVAVAGELDRKSVV